jgi:MFS family permease
MGTGVTWFALTMPLWIAGEVAYLAVAQEVVAALAPPHLHGSYFGLWGLSQGAAALIAPLLATALIGMGGTGLLWLTGALLAAGAALACLALHRAEQHRRNRRLALVLAESR